MPTTINPSGIRRNNTTISETPEETRVTLHQTVIAIWNRTTDVVALNTGGHNTPTTIRRMNECLHHWGFDIRVRKADFARTSSIVILGKGAAS
jgi:hypothetical protein